MSSQSSSPPTPYENAQRGKKNRRMLVGLVGLPVAAAACCVIAATWFVWGHNPNLIADLESMGELRTKIVRHFGTQYVDVNMQGLTTSGRRRATLRIAFTNASSSVAGGAGDRSTRAREVAAYAVAEAPTNLVFERVCVDFIERRDIGVIHTSRRDTHCFDPPDLASRGVRAPDGATDVPPRSDHQPDAN